MGDKNKKSCAIGCLYKQDMCNVGNWEELLSSQRKHSHYKNSSELLYVRKTLSYGLRSKRRQKITSLGPAGSLHVPGSITIT